MRHDPDLAATCGGTGWLDCECGGDMCVCLRYGGMDCPGCADCRDHDGYGPDEDDYGPYEDDYGPEDYVPDNEQ